VFLFAAESDALVGEAAAGGTSRQA
jgi:hypothetical protein